jgi:flagellin-like protein
MARKGISPVVAVVVLIGIAVMLGGLVSSWISSFVMDSSQHDTCAITTTYTISDAQVNQTSGKLRVTLKNTGKDSVYNFSVEADNGTLIEVLAATSPADTYVLESGRTQYIQTNISDYNISRMNITNINTITVLTQSCPEYSPKPITVTNI